VAGAAAQQEPAVQVLLPAVVLLPWIVPTALSALAFWWMYDAQFSVISWTLVKLG
jgi:multiple sugar transport system permease protein